MTAILMALIPALSRAQDDPPPQAGRLSLIYGNVSVQPAGSDDWGQAYPNYPIGPGDRIFTDQNSRAEIQVGRNYVRIAPNSDVTFVNFDSSQITFGIAQGSMHVRSRGLWEQQSLYVQTPSGTSTVNAPADYRVDVIPQDQASIFTTYDGDQYVSGAGDFGSDTPRGQALELAGTNPVYPQWLQPADYDELDRWSEQRDAQVARSDSYRYVSEDVPGAYDLDGNGQWMPGTEYGNVWFPNVQQGWAPYHNGHWVNHEPWGWVWVEDEQWGYAPFHYGRWVNYRGRWGWIPGPHEARPVWSPALVAFAGGVQFGGGGVSVWFPLGPGEPYRPWYPCSPRYIDQVNIANIQPAPHVRVEKTYVNIVNVTNVTNVTNVNNVTYVNRSIGATAMRQQDMAAGRPVAQSAVRVDPQQMARAPILARPQVQPQRGAQISAPPARPVPVAVARPVLINAKGQAVAARPKAEPVSAPVRQALAPRPLPGRTVVAPPPNVRMTPAARQAIQARPAAPQQQPAQSNRPAPVPANGNVAQPGRPQLTPPVQPGHPNLPPQQTQPIPAPGVHPPAQPENRPAPPPAQPQRPSQPEYRQAPPPAQPQRPAQPDYRQAPPPTQPPAQRPNYQQQPPPRPAQPENRPASPPAQPQRPPQPEYRQAPPPAQPPAQRPNYQQQPPSRPAQPENRPAPPPQARPNPQPEQRPAERPAPPPDRNRKPDPKDEPKRPQ